MLNANYRREKGEFAALPAWTNGKTSGRDRPPILFHSRGNLIMWFFHCFLSYMWEEVKLKTVFKSCAWLCIAEYTQKICINKTSDFIARRRSLQVTGAFLKNRNIFTLTYTAGHGQKKVHLNLYRMSQKGLSKIITCFLYCLKVTGIF